MTLNKQLINLLGILVAVIVLVAGLALIALPMYAQAQTIDANADTVDQTNSVYQTQIDALSAANARIDEIDQSLAGLRAEIAATPKLDDVYEIVGAAAQRADVRIESITAGDVEPWTARTALDADGNPVAAAPAASEPAEGDAEATSEATPEAAPEATTPQQSPQQQVLLTVTIDVTQPYAVVAPDESAVEAPAAEEPDAAAVRAEATARAQKAAAFVDSIGEGKRLLSPINVSYSDGKLTLSVLTFIRTEDAQ